ncbi:MAG: cytochrome c3 family protein [Thiohalomonadales bacterium]
MKSMFFSIFYTMFESGHRPERIRTLSLYTVAISLSLLLLSASPVMAASSDFDHFMTGFPLTGAHKRVECESCHQRGVFQGTPKQCNACHNGRTAPAASNNHIATTQTCDDCHTTFYWDTNAVDHSAVMGVCTSCHQLPPRHINSGNSMCDNCHNTLSWASNGFDHSSIAGDSCANCHNGTTATGKSAKHILTNQPCENCHRPRGGWGIYKMNHVDLRAVCSQCHDGKTARGRSPSHIATNGACDVCHTTNNWNSAGVDHTALLPGTRCVSCHNGSTARGVPPVPQHILSSDACDACHNTRSFSSVNRVDHGEVRGSCKTCHSPYPAGHISTTAECNTCHTSTSSWSVVTFDHATVSAPCTTCHVVNNGHPQVTADPCDLCHRNTSWTSMKRYTHTSTTYPGNHRSNVGCTNCHRWNSAAFNPSTRWNAPYKPFCAGCHANKFDRGESRHRRDAAGQRTVEANKDCDGSGCHRVNAGGWG